MDADVADRVLVITRILDAPRARVFEAWTRPEQLLQWWGPKDFRVTGVELDLRVGGRYRASMRSPEGQDYAMAGVFREVIPPERLVFTFAWDETHETMPRHETVVSLRLEAQGHRTKLMFQQSIFPSTTERDSHDGGWNECFDRLERYLAHD